MHELEEIFDYRGLDSGRRVRVVREEHDRALCGLTGSDILARTFAPKQFFPEWVCTERAVNAGKAMPLAVGR